MTVLPQTTLQPVVRAGAVPGRARYLAHVGAALVLFVFVNRAGYALAQFARLPLPGNLVGLLLLLALLATGALRLEWVEDCAAILNRHLAFFFIPITVGLMAYGPLIKHDGVAMLVTLVASASVGIGVTGFSAQVFADKGSRTTHAHPRVRPESQDHERGS